MTSLPTSVSATRNDSPACKGLQVTPASLTLAPNGSDQFIACTQYFSKYTITVSPSGILTAPTSPSSVTPTEPSGGTTYSATVTVTAGTTCGNATITVKDKRGTIKTVSVHVLCSQTFSYTGAVQTFTVPAGVTQVAVDAVGAGGGKGCLAGTGYTNAGGLGYELKASGIAVTIGQTLYVYVGGSPPANSGSPCDSFSPSYAGGGFNGGGTGDLFAFSLSSGGGGGASDIRTSSNDLTTRVIAAGGGGGGSSFGIGATGGNGGYPDGAAGSYIFFGSDPGSSLAGQGGTQNAGGAGGLVPNFPNIATSCAGSQGSLGAGGASGCSPGAGGGGYYGGGSGAVYGIEFSSDQGQSGGGGGSSFVQNGATVVTQQVATSGQCDTNNNGCITISY